MARPGTLYVVATPIGNLEDITLRALRVLGEVDIIAAEDTRAAQHLLGRHGLWPRTHERRAGSCPSPPPSPPRGEGVGRLFDRPSRHEVQLCSFFEGNEAERTAALLAALAEGQDVALISEAGMPLVSDPGRRLVAAAIDAGVPVQVLPGPSAVLTALVGSGLPADRFVFLGFPPRAEGARQALFGSLRGEPGTMVFLESPERTGRTLADLAQALGPERPACVARELTKVYEEFVRGPLAELAARYAEAPPRGEVTLVVGGASGPQAALGVADIEAAVRERLQAGQGAREIAAALALQTGLPRRQIYQIVLAARAGGPPVR